jgi:hypothetical protein
MLTAQLKPEHEAETAPSVTSCRAKRGRAGTDLKRTPHTPGTTRTIGTMVPAAVGRALARGAARWPRRSARRRGEHLTVSFFFQFS